MVSKDINQDITDLEEKLRELKQMKAQSQAKVRRIALFEDNMVYRRLVYLFRLLDENDDGVDLPGDLGMYRDMAGMPSAFADALKNVSYEEWFHTLKITVDKKFDECGFDRYDTAKEFFGDSGAGYLWGMRLSLRESDIVKLLGGGFYNFMGLDVNDILKRQKALLGLMTYAMSNNLYIDTKKSFILFVATNIPLIKYRDAEELAKELAEIEIQREETKTGDYSYKRVMEICAELDEREQAVIEKLIGCQGFGGTYCKECKWVTHSTGNCYECNYLKKDFWV
jgi:hypothetical protein